jgi:very-short-patch-repair endonuclease
MKFDCIKCKESITDEEYHFSYHRFGKALCREHQPTQAARRLGKKLEQLGDWTVKYEYFDGYKSVDLRIPSAKVDIEVDGLQHVTTKSQALSDLQRTLYSYRYDGIVTLHVPNILTSDDDTTDEAAKLINKFLEDNYEDIEDDD